jgi:hypothetical protein
MKGFSLILLVALISCAKQKNTATNDVQQTVVKDCKCDRVVSVNQFSMPDMTQWGYYITINDCSGVQMNKQWMSNKPVIGQCK